MAALVDASSPVRWTAVMAVGATTLVSASFTAPANSLLVVTVECDGGTDAAWASTDATVTDSSGLTWTQQVKRSWSETTAGGCSEIWTAVAAASTARTVTLTRPAGGTGSLRASCKCYVVTGADLSGTPVDTVGASNEGGSATNNLTTTSVTPGATGLLFVAGTDWNALGGGTTPPTSSDLTADAATYSGQIDALSGYKAVTSGVAANANLNAAGTAAAQWKWCQVVVRAAAGGGVTVSADGAAAGGGYAAAAGANLAGVAGAAATSCGAAAGAGQASGAAAASSPGEGTAAAGPRALAVTAGSSPGAGCASATVSALAAGASASAGSGFAAAAGSAGAAAGASAEGAGCALGVGAATAGTGAASWGYGYAAGGSAASGVSQAYAAGASGGGCAVAVGAALAAAGGASWGYGFAVCPFTPGTAGRGLARQFFVQIGRAERADVSVAVQIGRAERADVSVA